MKPAWKEQTGGLREEGKSKMAHNFRNEVRKLNLITSSRPNGSKRRMAQYLRNEVSKYVYITSYRPNGSKRRMAQKEASV